MPGKRQRRPRRRYGVIGYPVAHSASPAIHRYWAARYDKHISYEPIEARPDRFRATVEAFFRSGGAGLNVTAPHKASAFALGEDISARARACGAANLLERRDDDRIYADNTDGTGLVHDLTHNLGLDLEGARIAVLGAGGAARGILPPLAEAKPLQLVLAHRNADKARLVARTMSAQGIIESADFATLSGQRFDLLINATSAGFAGDTPQIPADIIGMHCVCYDLSYGKPARPFLDLAEHHGARLAVDGWGLLVEQAAESFLVWLGVRPDTGDVLAQREQFIPRDTRP